MVRRKRDSIEITEINGLETDKQITQKPGSLKFQ
jgi:hypothetical protein